ncbi:hypothetical protein C8R34_1445 [Nitrosomonas sp. Nm84]|uniref:hypothetical protein n=1 Tax=Nitrosomonas sp. Nm84 TaxID=200124 RepID=UPI000D7683E6|nr:hypothetical protein [Nitrosomonas sp. Nm84]PXW80872.1 hypothetical protein C8R34_1445 [Nitrosomonas sp. Nm84]
MGAGKIPGIYGYWKNRYGCVFNHGPTDLSNNLFDDFLHYTPGPMGTVNDLGAIVARSEAVNPNSAEEELKRLIRVYGAIKNSSGKKSYSYWSKGKRQYRVSDYMTDRNSYFGSEATYREFLLAATSELDADNEKLRKYIEPNPATRNNHADWKEAQNVFYAWVRKAYLKKLGDNTDIPKLIKSQMSEKLKTALDKVKVDYGKDFKYGGFNPRPMKLEGYRFGTISEHGIGTAVDVESAKNAQIKIDVWKAIQSFTGKSLSHATAQSKWKTAPKELYESFKAINDEFVSRLGKAVKNAEASDAKKDPLSTAIESDESLKLIDKANKGFIKQWQKGFFDLPWELVKEFHEEGFLWGATFEHPDLHHFEL